MPQQQSNSNLISAPKTKEELGEQFGLKGKELTSKVKELQKGGAIISILKFVNPASGPKRQRHYCFIATQQQLSALGGE